VRVRAVRLIAFGSPIAVLVVYVLLLAQQTDFTCAEGRYIGWSAIGLLIVTPLAGVLTATAAALQASRYRGQWALGGLALGVIVAGITIAVVWEVTPLGDCYT
jgi:hypothetical protein